MAMPSKRCSKMTEIPPSAKPSRRAYTEDEKGLRPACCKVQTSWQVAKDPLQETLCKRSFQKAFCKSPFSTPAFEQPIPIGESIGDHLTCFCASRAFATPAQYLLQLLSYALCSRVQYLQVERYELWLCRERVLQSPAEGFVGKS